MFLKVRKQLFPPFNSLFSTRQRVLAGALIVAAIAVACGSDSGGPASGGNTPDPTSPPITSPDGTVTKAVDAAPSFVVETFSHGTYDLDATVGRPVLINFWFPSCPPCRAEMPDLQAAHEKYGDEVDFIGVQQTAVDTVAEGVEFVEELGITYINFADETDETVAKVQRDYRVLSYPTTFFLNRDHSINREWTGLIRESALEEQIEQIIAS